MISKIELKVLKINLMLELFMCLTLELFEFIFKIYSLRQPFQIQCDFKILASFVLFTFSFVTQFFTFFSQQELSS
jgi:hypothetical protein